jgi:hypothetical protein
VCVVCGADAVCVVYDELVCHEHAG